MFEFSKLTHGDPRSPPLIFLHGFMGSKEDWKEMLERFESRFFCIALDLPGHGSTPYSDEMLSVLKKEIRKLSRVKPVIIGYSMGGRIALRLQHLAAGIAAISAHPGLKSKKEKEERRKIDEAWCEKLLTLPFDLFFAEWYAQPIFRTVMRNSSLMQLLIKRRMKQNPDHLSQALRQMSLANQPNITRYRCPCLFLYGEEDLKYQEIYSKLPKTVSVDIIRNAGHAVHFENARECAEKILDWLQKLGAYHDNT
jgi:2-succinyl-6-hydroxy-2,4-cyclohexadiene-1-carboxylate synthase